MIKEIQAKKMLLKVKEPRSWFSVSHYMNIYRGCEHHCIYCDSRSECYQVAKFDEDILVKENVLSLLRRELMSKKEKGVIGFGSMSDPYIPLERKYQLTRKALDIVREFKFPAFILTKSDLVLRDLDILIAINKQNYANVVFTITTYDDQIAKVIEPSAPLPSKRFNAMNILAKAGIKVGVMMAPILPFILDNEHNIRKTIELAKENGASFIVATFGVTLRDRQREYYYQKLDEYFPLLKEKYKKTFGNSYFCAINNFDKIRAYFYQTAKEIGMETKMPKYSVKNDCQQVSMFDII